MTSFRDHLLSTRPNSPFPLLNDDGALTGPFGQMERLGGVGYALADLGESLRYRSPLSNTQREAAILWVAWKRDCDYEMWAHRKVAETQQCLTAHDIDVLCSGRLADIRDSDARRAARLADRILVYGVPGTETPNQSPETNNADGNFSGEEAELLHFLVLVHYYDLLAQMMAIEAASSPK